MLHFLLKIYLETTQAANLLRNWPRIFVKCAQFMFRNLLRICWGLLGICWRTAANLLRTFCSDSILNLFRFYLKLFRTAQVHLIAHKLLIFCSVTDLNPLRACSEKARNPLKVCSESVQNLLRICQESAQKAAQNLLGIWSESVEKLLRISS